MSKFNIVLTIIGEIVFNDLIRYPIIFFVFSEYSSHNSNCRYYDCKSCTKRFASPAEARGAGYTACKVCGG